MAIDWHQIQPFNGSQNNAFEELVCQLAREEFGNEGEFIRFGTPDGGLEAICKFDDGRVYGWQAKYFLYSFTSTQWQQIKDSFENAVTNYPDLTHFFLCVPLDRNNPCVKGKESFRNKWDNKVLEWKEWAKEKGRKVDIKFWGSSELIDFLSKRENIGRKAFWFKETELSCKWFEDYNSSAIKNLGARYTPELNIELSISEAFEALARSNYFKNKFNDYFHKKIIDLKTCDYLLNSFPELKIKFTTKILELINLLKIDQKKYAPTHYLLINKITNCVNEIEDSINNFLIGNESLDGETNEKLKGCLYRIHAFEGDFDNFNLAEINLYNGQVLWIEGEAGVGKSHLIADMIQRRYKRNKYSILLLGQHFTESANIWHQILDKIMRVKMDSHKFLSILETIADAQQERVIIAIDALNESNDRRLWIENLNGFIHDVLKHPKIGLVVSVRSSYQQLFIQNLSLDIKEKICFVKHDGFFECDFEAIEHFFDFYSLPYPTVPLLNREFSNPLYLKLYCETLKNQAAKTIPKGSMGIKQLINSYLDHLENNIAERLGVRSSMHLVQKAINVIIESQLTSETLFYEDTRIAISTHLINFIPDTDAKNFIDYLLKEQLLNVNMIAGSEIVYFTYERIRDYLSAEYILQNIDNCAQFNQWLSLKLGEKLVDKFKIYKGLWEAISVLLPERLGVELFETLVWNKINSQNQTDLINLIIANLPWRTPASIKANTLIPFLNKNQCNFNNSIWLDTLYQLAAEKGNPFNADYLYNCLFPLSLADRDAIWSIPITESYGNLPAIDYLLNWSEQHNNRDIDHNLLMLIAIAASWLLTTTHIKLRNDVIQALAYLCWNRLHLARELFLKFAMVNDPYILEGILAAIEAAVLNADNLAGLKELAETVDNRFFKVADGEEVYPNILVRDHARYIIEYSLLKDNYSEIEKQSLSGRITPPYKSFLPQKYTTNEEIKKKYVNKDELFIIHSMVTKYEKDRGNFKDFGRYVFGKNLNLWKQQFEENNLNPNLLTNYAIELIFEKFGYSSSKHGEFDSKMLINSRFENIIDRVGKKYQWLAMYEVIAKLMDNYKGKTNSFLKNSGLKWISEIKDFTFPITKIDLIPCDKSNFFPKDISEIPKANDEFLNFENDKWIENDFLFSQILKLIEVNLNGEIWLVLNGEMQTDSYDSNFGMQRDDKEFWLQLTSYFIKQDDLSRVKNAFDNSFLFEENLVDIPVIMNINFRKFLTFHNYNKDDEYEWKKIWDDEINQIYFQNQNKTHKSKPHFFKILPTTVKVEWNHINDRNEPLIPCQEIFKKMNLRWSSQNNCWVGLENKPICVNLLVDENIPFLIIKKEELLSFLQKNRLKIFWIMKSEQKVADKQSSFYKINEKYGFYYINRKAKNKPIIGCSYDKFYSNDDDKFDF